MTIPYMVWVEDIHQSQNQGGIYSIITSLLTNQGGVGFKVYIGEGNQG